MPAFNAGEPIVASFADFAQTPDFTLAGSADRLLLALAAAGSPFSIPDPPNIARYGGSGGTAMTQVGATLDFGGSRCNLWRSLPGPSGSQNGYQTGAGSTVSNAIIALGFTGVDQTTPYGSVLTPNNSPSGTTGVSVSPSVALTSMPAGSLGVAFFAITADNSEINGISGALRSHYEAGFPYMAIAAVVGEPDGGGNATLTCTTTAGTSTVLRWQAAALVLNPAAGAVVSLLMTRRRRFQQLIRIF